MRAISQTLAPATALLLTLIAAAPVRAARESTAVSAPEPPPPPTGPSEEGLTELARVERIPGFAKDYGYAAYEDRVVLRDPAAKRESTLGVAGRGKAVGAAFRPLLARGPAAAALGEPVSLELRTFGGAVTVQLFEGGAAVQEKETGRVWWNAHARRPRDLRPADEITRYPRVVVGGRVFAVAVGPDRVVIADPAAKASVAVPVGPPGRPIPAAFRRVIDRDKLDGPFGAAVSAEAGVFDTPLRVQVYEGGVLVVEPGTDRFWWCTHPKRPPAGGPAVALPRDPDAVVVRLDYVGGYTPPRNSNDPYLVIRADGRVTLTDPFGNRPAVHARLAPRDVLDLVRFAVAENRFFDLDTAALDREVRAAVRRRQVPTVTDLPTLVLTVRTADRTHEVRCYAPEFYAEHLPDLPALQRLQAVHHRLTAYMDGLRDNRPPG